MIFSEINCRHCNLGEKRSLFRPSLKRWKFEKLLSIVRKMIVEEPKSSVTVESYASTLKCKKHLIDRCFALLNKEGLLSQAYNRPPHDSSRDPDTWGKGDSAWMASTYTVIKNIKEIGHGS